mmetsp:Transcript_30649/g.90997  ORF Transcript_30649/g.90997 Transcript_30649/m.90997 type:complete len:402 (-) Transcript_30649:7-1212(-)
MWGRGRGRPSRNALRVPGVESLAHAARLAAGVSGKPLPSALAPECVARPGCRRWRGRHNGLWRGQRRGRRRWRWRGPAGRCHKPVHGDVCAIPKLLGEHSFALGAACDSFLRRPRRHSLRCPLACIPAEALHFREVRDVSLVIITGVAGRPIPLQRTPLAREPSGDEVAHGVIFPNGGVGCVVAISPEAIRNLRVVVRRGKVPTLRVVLIDGLTISWAICLAVGSEGCTTQHPAVQAGLPIGGVGEGARIQCHVTDAELVVAHVVGGDTHFELDHGARSVACLHRLRYHVGLLLEGNDGAALHWIATQAMGAWVQARGPYAGTARFDSPWATRLEAVLAHVPGDHVPRAGLGQERVASRNPEAQQKGQQSGSGAPWRHRPAQDGRGGPQRASQSEPLAQTA